MSIRDRIQGETVINRIEVEHNGEKYLIVGSYNANIMADTIMLRPEQVDMYAKHWSNYTKEPVEPILVKQIWVLHRTLQPCTWDAATNEWVNEDPYDVTEIARLAQKDGPLFLKLTAAAFKSIGLGEDDLSNKSTFDEIAAGNSENPAPTN